MNDNNYRLDSNALARLDNTEGPPQIRGIPFQGKRQKVKGKRLKDLGFFRNAGSAPVVAKQQPLVRGRPLSKLRDGPLKKLAVDYVILSGVEGCILQMKSAWLMVQSSKLNWDWNIPPDPIFSVALRDPDQIGTVNSVVKKEINHGPARQHQSGREYTESTKDEVWIDIKNSDKIRSRSFALRDVKSLTGGRLMIERLKD